MTAGGDVGGWGRRGGAVGTADDDRLRLALRLAVRGHRARRRFVAARRWGVALANVFDPLDDVVEHGRQEDAEERDAEHAGEDGDAEGLAHLGAGAFA